MLEVLVLDVLVLDVLVLVLDVLDVLVLVLDVLVLDVLVLDVLVLVLVLDVLVLVLVLVLLVDVLVVELLVLEVLVVEVLVVELLVVVGVGPPATGVSRSVAISAALSARGYTRTSSIRPPNASFEKPIPIRSWSAFAANELVSASASRSTPLTYSRTTFAASLYTAATCCHAPGTRPTPLVTCSRHTPPA